MSEDLFKIDDHVLDITVAALQGLQDCIVAGDFDSPEYRLYKNSLHTGLTFFEGKKEKSNVMDTSE